MLLHTDWGMAKLTGAFLRRRVVKHFAVNGIVQRERCGLYSGVVRFESVIITPMGFTQSSQANSRILPLIKPPIHYSFIIVSFHVLIDLDSCVRYCKIELVLDWMKNS